MLFSLVWGLACQTALARGQNVMSRNKSLNFIKTPGSFMIKNKWRAQKGSRTQATSGLAGKPPHRLFMVKYLLRSQR